MKEKTKKGLSMRNLNYIMSGVTIVISALLLITTFLTGSRYRTVQDNTDAYISWNKNAELLLSGSDFLTEQARLFAYKGERTYLDNYFKEATETKRRDAALEALNDVRDSDAFKKLEAAMHESVELMQTEYYSMRLVVEAKGDDVKDYPVEIQNVVLTAEDKALGADEKLSKALAILVNEEYEGSKEIIRDNTQKCIGELADIMEQRMGESLGNLNSMMFFQQALIIGLVAVIIAILVLTSVQIIRPLANAVPRIREEQPLPTGKGAYEYRYLAKTYNGMFEQNRESRRQLTYEANHDKLTGLFNRNGFEQFVATTNLETSAFMLIDIDDFKKINDSSGHSAGDKALIALSGRMRANFRTGDCLCRLGGDEFLVVLTRISRDREHFKERISEKIDRINKQLSEMSGQGLPTITVSAGVAVGAEAQSIDEALKHADKALYEVKKAGKKACRFYVKETMR